MMNFTEIAIQARAVWVREVLLTTRDSLDVDDITILQKLFKEK